MVPGVRKSKQRVRIGCQQRSCQYFQDWSTKIWERCIGKITRCVLLHHEYVGNFLRRRREQAGPPPSDLDWEMFQGPAKRHPFVLSRLGWRLYWDCGGGSITDWGVHLTDVMLWCMNADRKTPSLTSASAVDAFNRRTLFCTKRSPKHTLGCAEKRSCSAKEKWIEQAYLPCE